MIVNCLKTVNFRNLKEVTFNPCPTVNVLYGDNAQGKTNLIEALWLFTGARSFRGSKDAEFVGFGQNFARLSMDFSGRGVDNSASIVIGPSKQVELNSIKLERVSMLAGSFCAVVFSPDHLNLVKEGPAHRRKFLDCAISEIHPRHVAALSEYRELLRQRNALLKDIPFHSELIDTLPVWDERLARSGAYVVFTRLRYLKRLCDHAAEIYDGIAAKTRGDESKEKLRLEYEAEGGLEYSPDLSDAKKALPEIYQKLLNKLSAERSGDIECGYTRVGPHRDDLKITIGGLDSRLYASQGQQRSAVLSLKLAEARVLKETINESPVLLLDDVMSELDRYRQDYILNNIGGCQVFITCCDPAGLDCLEGGAVFKVKEGTLERTRN